MSEFRVGNKVTCVNADNTTKLTVGGTYTIADVDHRGYVMLKEVKTGWHWKSMRFKKVQAMKMTERERLEKAIAFYDERIEAYKVDLVELQSTINNFEAGRAEKQKLLIDLLTVLPAPDQVVCIDADHLKGSIVLGHTYSVKQVGCDRCIQLYETIGRFVVDRFKPIAETILCINDTDSDYVVKGRRYYVEQESFNANGRKYYRLSGIAMPQLAERFEAEAAPTTCAAVAPASESERYVCIFNFGFAPLIYRGQVLQLESREGQHIRFVGVAGSYKQHDFKRVRDGFANEGDTVVCTDVGNSTTLTLGLKHHVEHQTIDAFGSHVYKLRGFPDRFAVRRFVVIDE